ncbi:hypothetical protein AC579_8893 [Pseudocercospora musae]|uniref:ceramidase n=1 Tax=Pseudocercospora musae TaxID=113226 RepID=A0A139GTB6_9PEZI|nr:hypothetical protein AC579_8893 [Pseudocercospora musae]
MPPTTRAQTIREAIATSADPHHAIASVDQIKESDQQGRSTGSKKSSKSSLRSRYPDTPPRFVINLSLPPEQRYLKVCAAFKQEISDLTPLFDEVVGGMLQAVPLTWLHRACRLLLRGVYDSEENKELKGISKATGVAMYLLVCFNVLLDLFMGCSSGGAAIRDGDMGVKMLHFRTLDWGMPSLRKIVVQLDFVTQDGGPVVASSLTYAGYVGVLTGVKKDLSLSLNFRPNRLEKGKWLVDVKYYWHLAMVLLGRRRSISSELRRFLLPRPSKQHGKEEEKDVSWSSPKYAEIVEKVRCSSRKPLKTTACYLCFSNGQETTVFEKDYSTAVFRSSNEMIVITNNDLEAESANSPSSEQTSQYVGALREILDEAQDRRKCAGHNYTAMKADAARRHRSASVEGDDSSRLLDVEHISLAAANLLSKTRTRLDVFDSIFSSKSTTITLLRYNNIPFSTHQRAQNTRGVIPPSTMTAHVPMARVPFAPLDNPRLQHLASAKNRQNGVLAQKSSSTDLDGKISITKPNTNKRSFEPSTFDGFDSENVDPAMFDSPPKKTKSDAAKPFTFSLTSAKPMPPPSAFPSRMSTPVRASISSPHTPLTAPAGRSPKRKIAGLKQKRRVSAPFSRIDPPSFASRGGSALPFSLDAVLSGTSATPIVTKSAGATIQESMPQNWFFDIYEDTPEEEAANLMEHSTLTLDLSSDDEGAVKQKDDRGKENTPPEGYDAPTASRSPVEGVAPRQIKKKDIVRKKIVVDEMDDGARSPLSDLETEPFIPEGLTKNSHVIVDEEVEKPKGLGMDLKDLFATPVEKKEEVVDMPVVDGKGDVKGEIIVWKDA